MIIEFKIKNFLSYKEEQTLSFIASSDKENEETNVVKILPNLRLLKIAAIYGANASGKTNILNALDFIRFLSYEYYSDELKASFAPFLLDSSSKNNNSEFELSFICNGKKFIYNIELNQSSIVKEQLKYYPTIRPALVFEREHDINQNVNSVKLGEKTEASQKEIDILASRVTHSYTLLAAYQTLNMHIPLLEEVANWLKNDVLFSLRPHLDPASWTTDQIFNSAAIKSFGLNALKSADFNISELSKITEGLALNESRPWENVMFSHKVNGEIFTLPYSAQSRGTRRYYGLSGPLFLTSNRNVVLPIDEIESALHTDLVLHYIKTFLINSKESQLIFTTHNRELLSDEICRRDSIWFCEKDKNGSTELYSAADFKLRKGAPLAKYYKIGKLGASPQLGDIYIDYEAEKEK